MSTLGEDTTTADGGLDAGAMASPAPEQAADSFETTEEPAEAGTGAEEATEPTEPGSAEPDGASVEAGFASLNGRLDEISHLLGDRARGYEETIRALQTQAQELQRDQVRSLLKPVFERLARLHSQARDSAGTASDSEVARDFAYFADSIEELLSLLDVESIEARDGDRMTARMHHTVRSVPTDEPELDGRIQRVVRQGFAFAGADRPLLPARVAVYRYVEPSSQESGEAARSDE